MSEKAAHAFLDRIEADAAFAAELEAFKEDPAAVLARVHEAGFDATQTEIRTAFLERYGAELSPEQLEAVAAGVETGTIVGASVGGGVGLLVGMVAAAAAGLSI